MDGDEATRKSELPRAVSVDILTREKKSASRPVPAPCSAVSTRRVPFPFQPATGSPRVSHAPAGNYFFPPPRLLSAPRDVGFAADASVLLGGGLHFDSFSPVRRRRLTCPGPSSSHDPCVCPRDQRFHLRKSVPLNISGSHPRRRKKKPQTTTPSPPPP